MLRLQRTNPFSSILEIIDTRSLSAMLFHLIDRNPNKDITLHVSANNPAMVRLLSLRSDQVP